MTPSSSMHYYKDKTALVTGAGTGLGYALAKSLVSMGARVMATDIDEARLLQLKEHSSDLPGRLITEILDVRDRKQFKRCIELLVEKWGKLDILLNNAGVCNAGEIVHLEDHHWKDVIDINLIGTINGCTAAVGIMTAQGFGHIVNISSIAGLVPFPVTAPYNISKSGIIALSRTLRMEMAGRGIAVTLVCPGQLNTGMFKNLPTANLQRSVIDNNNPFKPVNIQKAAHKILNAARKGKFFLVFPFYARLLWNISRLFPGLTDTIFKHKMSRFRE